MPVNVTGLGPYIKRAAVKVFVAGSGFKRGDRVQFSILNLVTRDTTTRTGVVEHPIDGGCIVRIMPRPETTDLEPMFDDDLAEITVTVTNSDNESDSATETGIVE